MMAQIGEISKNNNLYVLESHTKMYLEKSNDILRILEKIIYIIM